MAFYKGVKGPKLVLNGFSYFRNNAVQDRTYWLCSKNRSIKCKARLITLSKTNEVIIKNQRHNHSEDGRGPPAYRLTLEEAMAQF